MDPTDDLNDPTEEVEVHAEYEDDLLDTPNTQSAWMMGSVASPYAAASMVAVWNRGVRRARHTEREQH